MTDQTETPKHNSWFDRELAWLVGIFGLLWVFIGGGAFYAYPILACLNFNSGDPSAVCQRAIALPMLPDQFKSDARMKMIVAHVNKGQYDQALAVIADEEKTGSGTALLFEKKADALRYLGRTEEALVAYRKTLALAPSNEDVAITLVTLELDSRNFNGARQVAADYVAKNPTSVPMIAWQGWVEHRAGGSALGLSIYDRAFALAPDDSSLYRDVADIQVALGKPVEAITALSKAIELSPDDANYLIKRAEIYDSMGDLALSQADYEKSLALDRSTSTLIALGRSYTDGKRYDEALTVLNEAIGQDYEIEWALASKIRLHLFEGKVADAKSVLAELTAKNATSPDVLYWKASIATQEERFEDALKDLQTLLKDYPNYSDALLETGHTLIELKRPAESISYFTSSIVSWPNSDLAYLGRARGHLALENWLAAISDANQSIKLKPKQGRAHGYRALALIKTGRIEEAKAGFETALKNDPTIDWIYQEYFGVLLSANDVEGAKAVLNSLRSNIPNSSYITEFEATLTARGVVPP